jgi:TP901 family phage tail tape measure protein
MSTGALGMKIRAGGAYVTLGVNDRLSGGLMLAERKLAAFGQRVGALGAKLGTASLAILGPTAAASRTFAGFEKSMAKVNAIITPTKAEFQALWDTAKKLGAETQFTASDAARGMATLAQANFKTNQILAAMLPILDLAAAGEMDVAEAADIAAQIMNSMNISADDVGTAIDVLTKATQTANTDLRELGHAFTYAGAIASSAGASFEEATVFLQMMSNAGIKADMAGTTLRGALLALTSPSQMARERLTELGVDIDTLEGNFASLSEVIRQFEAKLGGMGTAERMRFLGDIFDNRQASGFAKAVANGAVIFREMEKSLYNSTGAARKFAGTMMNTLTGSFDYMTSAFEGLQISIGELLQGHLNGFLAAVTDLIGKFDSLVKNNKDFLVQLLVGAGAAGAFGAALIGVSFAISTIGTLLGPLTFALTTAISAMTTFAALVPLLLNPWIGIPVLIGAVILAFNDWGLTMNNVGEHFASWSDWMVTTARYAFDGIANALKAGDMMLAINILMTSIKFAFAKTLKEIAELFNTTVKDMVAGTIAPIRGVMRSLTWLKMEYAKSNHDAQYLNYASMNISREQFNARMAPARAQANNAISNFEFWDKFDPDQIGQSVASALDTGSLFEELVNLRKEAERAALIAEEERKKTTALGPARAVPELRLPDGVIPQLNAPELNGAAMEMRNATQFAAIGSYGGHFLDRMKPGGKPVTEKIADNTKKMVSEQQQTNQLLEDMNGLAFE